MNQLLNRLFGLGSDGGLGFGSPDAKLSFVHSFDSWIVAGVLLGLAGIVWWSYRSIPGSKSIRTALGSVRFVGVAVLFALAMGPMIEQTSIQTEQDWAMVLLDRSSSMHTRDAIATDELVSRDDQLMKMIEGASTQWDALADRKHVVWMGFGDLNSMISIGHTPGLERIGEPNGQRTNLNDAIRGALDEAAARPISSIVIASDGRSFEPIDPELINELQSAQIPIFAVALGANKPVRDIGISQVEYPQAAFADDLVPIRVLLRSAGVTRDELDLQSMRVDLVDHGTGEVIDSTIITHEHLGLGEDSAKPVNEWVSLSYTPIDTGERAFDVVIHDGKTDGTNIDLNPSNDQSAISLRVVDRPMRVLYIDGYPRWEHRYLKNLLLRERSIVSSSMLLSSSRRYMQEGDELIAALPTTLEQWEPIDVVILGDVRPQLFSDQQLETLLEHITRHGAGLLWIAGPSSTPGAWLDSPLAALLPMHRDAGGSQSAVHAWDEAVTMRSTEEADRLGVLGLDDARTGWFDRLSEPSTGWSKLQWAIDLDESSFKPGVSVLARARSVSSNKESPIITMMRYGAGRSIFVGTDEIWRWRYGRGEDLPERFWLPIVRTLGRGTVDRRSASGSLSISPKNPAPGQPAQITLRLYDQAKIDTMPSEVRVEVRSISALDEPTTITLRGSGDTRIGTWIPEHPGTFDASLVRLDLELEQITTRTRVLANSAESRVLDTNHALLAQLAAATGGQLIKPEDFATIPQQMPNRMRTITSPPNQASLWDRPVVLIFLVLLLTIEWIGRRILRLA